MQTRWLLMALCLCAGIAVAKEGPVRVEFVNPEKFSDVNDRQFASRPDKNPNLHAIRKHAEERAARYLGAGQTLRLEFLDIDLAGDHRPQQSPQLSDVRLVTRLYPPRMHLRFELKDAQGQLIDSGEAKLSDLAFDTRSAGLGSEPLRYDMRMLDDWLRKQFRR